MKVVSILSFIMIMNVSVLVSEPKSLSRQKLEKYKTFLIDGTYFNQNWSKFAQLPLSRYETFLAAFEHFEKHHGKIIVELGTTRSFVHGGHEGCNKSDTRFWMPNNPEHWDWTAGCFTRTVADCLRHTNPEIYTIDLDAEAIKRCKIMTNEYNNIINYYTTDSESFLRNCSFKNGIDLIYLDTGYMNPIEPTAQLQLREVQIIVERNLLAPHGLLLIDDVRNQQVNDADSDLGKSKYALPYLLTHGFEIVLDGYQVLLRRIGY